MPAIRYIIEYEDGVEVNRIPYEVSEEQLQVEADEARLKEIANMPDEALKVPLLAESLKLLCKKLGFG